MGGYFAPTFKSACSVITGHTLYVYVNPVRALELAFQGKSVADQSLIRLSKTNVEGCLDENLPDSLWSPNLTVLPSDI